MPLNCTIFKALALIDISILVVLLFYKSDCIHIIHTQHIYQPVDTVQLNVDVLLEEGTLKELLFFIIDGVTYKEDEHVILLKPGTDLDHTFGQIKELHIVNNLTHIHAWVMSTEEYSEHYCVYVL